MWDIASKYLIAGVGLILAHLLRKAIKRIEGLSETRMKAELAFQEVSEREPEYKKLYEAWQRAR